jgi:hypothetical protein
MNEKMWKPLEGSITWREGSRAPWFEMIVAKSDGTQVKLVAKKVPRFWSERDSSNQEL